MSAVAEGRGESRCSIQVKWQEKIRRMLSVPFLWVLGLVFIKKNLSTTSTTDRQTLGKGPFPEECANF